MIGKQASIPRVCGPALLGLLLSVEKGLDTASVCRRCALDI